MGGRKMLKVKPLEPALTNSASQAVATMYQP